MPIHDKGPFKLYIYQRERGRQKEWYAGWGDIDRGREKERYAGVWGNRVGEGEREVCGGVGT